MKSLTQYILEAENASGKTRKIGQAKRQDLANLNLSDRENTVGGIARSYIENNAKKLAPFKSAKEAADAISAEIQSYVGKGISEATFKKVKAGLYKQATIIRLLYYLTNLEEKAQGNGLND